MKNRINLPVDPVPEAAAPDPAGTNTFFLACEFKPNTPLFSVLDPFAYDIKPAFVHGTLGVLGYEPAAFGVVDLDDEALPLLGYVFTVTEPTTALLLDKVKGYYGEGGFNFHDRRLVKAYTDVGVAQDAWVYVVSDRVLEAFESVESIDMGIWTDEDDGLLELLERIENSLDGDKPDGESAGEETHEL